MKMHGMREMRYAISLPLQFSRQHQARSSFSVWFSMPSFEVEIKLRSASPKRLYWKAESTCQIINNVSMGVLQLLSYLRHQILI